MTNIKIKFTLNGKPVEKEVKPNITLLDLLRHDFKLTGTKKGCDIGDCGACTVLLDDQPVNACLILTPKINNRSVVTVEGLGKPGELHPLQEAFINNHATQCGYCTSGMLLSSKALLDKNPHPSREEAKKAVEGNLCRCTGYNQIIDAIVSASEEVKRGESS